MNTLPLDTVICGDCVEVMDTLPPSSIDLIFADPPYNLQLSQVLFRPNNTRVDAVDDEWDRFASMEEYDQFTERWLKSCKRILKKTGTLWVIGSYHNIYRVGRVLMDLGYWILNDIVWVKTNPMPNFRGVRFTNAHETLLWAQGTKGAKYTFHHHDLKALNDDLQMRSDWHIPICTGAERIRHGGTKAHSTQKPEALLYRVIMSSSNPGDVVLDPFFGSGTTGAVAKALRRHWIGIDREQSYVEISRKRIDEVVPSLLDESVFAPMSQVKRERVPFGDLIAVGLILPGQLLRFRTDPSKVATVLANGHIKYNGIVGSIHLVGRELLGSPCNGWDHWLIADGNDGATTLLDELRHRYRELANMPQRLAEGQR